MDSFISALDLARAIRSKELSPLEAVDHYLARADRFDGVLNAFTWRRDDELRAEAKRAGDAVVGGAELGPLHGVPIPIKDLTDVAGWPTTFGSRAAEGRVAKVTAHVAQALADAGALLMARTNTPEFGTVSVTENDLYGATRNPWNTNLTPGGSSGGASAAVAAGMAPAAHANDGGGSIRIPAGCAGLVGLKPSRGRVPNGPLISDVMHGGAVEGVVTHTVADTAAIFDVIGTQDPLAWYNAPAPERPFLQEVGRDPGRLRIGFTTKSPSGSRVDPEIVAATERTARRLEDLGHDVFEAAPEWPDAEQLIPMFSIVWNTGSAYWDLRDPDKIEPLNAALRAAAAATDSLTYVQGVLALQIASRIMCAAWGRDFDVLLTPTLAIRQPPIGWVFENVAENPIDPLMRAAEMAPFTVLFNVTGQPAISLPIEVAGDGLPIGMQLVGRPFGESELIRLGSQLEAAVGWTSRRPPMAAD